MFFLGSLKSYPVHYWTSEMSSSFVPVLVIVSGSSLGFFQHSYYEYWFFIGAPPRRLCDFLFPSGTKKEPKPKLLSPDIFWWGGGLPREGVGAKKFGMSLETQGIKLLWRDIPGFCRDIPEAPEKFEKKMFGFNSRPLSLPMDRRCCDETVAIETLADCNYHLRFSQWKSLELRNFPAIWPCNGNC